MALLRLRQSGLPFRAGMRGRTVAHGHAPKSREETRRGLSRTARAATWAPTRPRLQGCHLRSRPWELLATHVIHGFFRCGLYPVCLFGETVGQYGCMEYFDPSFRRECLASHLRRAVAVNKRLDCIIVLWSALPKRSAVAVWTPSALGGVAGHQHFFCSTQ